MDGASPAALESVLGPQPKTTGAQRSACARAARPQLQSPLYKQRAWEGGWRDWESQLGVARQCGTGAHQRFLPSLPMGQGRVALSPLVLLNLNDRGASQKMTLAFEPEGTGGRQIGFHFPGCDSACRDEGLSDLLLCSPNPGERMTRESQGGVAKKQPAPLNLYPQGCIGFQWVEKTPET